MASYVFDREARTFVPRDEYYAARFARTPPKTADLPMPYVRGDIQPYVSPVTGKTIDGRAARREDLARSGCREVDPSECKPLYQNYEFCQRKRLPYMGADVPPPMTRDEKAWAKERRAKEKAAKAKAEGEAPFKRGNTKDTVLFKNNTVKEA